MFYAKILGRCPGEQSYGVRSSDFIESDKPEHARALLDDMRKKFNLWKQSRPDDELMIVSGPREEMCLPWNLPGLHTQSPEPVEWVQ